MGSNLFKKINSFFKQKKELKRRVDERTLMITEGLGGKDNINDVACCCTRLRLNVYNPEKIKEDILKKSGAAGIIKKDNYIQVIYGPKVTSIKRELVGYLNENI